jgi:peptide/nickel transport system substrate-binding protein
MIEGSAGHIPRSQMDPQVRMYYEFHPDEAKKVLAAEGYPDGFKLVGVVGSADTAGVAMMELAKSYWAEVGVDLEIRALEQMALGTARRERTYDVIKSSGLQVGREVGTFNKHSINFAGGWNDAIWTDPSYYDPLFVDASATLDVEERNKKWAALAKVVAEEVAYVPIGLEYELTYWWPWVKNYYGESSVTYRSSAMVEAGIWIDQAMKKEMGF